jgi:hypothetical protein
VNVALLADLVRRNGSAWLTIAGSSMEPTLPLGTRVRVTPCPRPRAGDVVVLAAGDHVVVHRLLAVVGPVVVHAGDAGRPGLARRRDVIGRVAARRVSVLRRVARWFG